MGIDKGSTFKTTSWPWWRWVLTGLILLALALSIIMSWHYLQGGSIAGCGSGSPCEQVLSSRWSTIAGILPVSGLAVGVYLSMLIASFFIGPSSEFSIRKLAWSVLLILAGTIIGSAVWFTVLQKWMIGEFCPYCMTAHSAGLLVGALVFWQAIKYFSEQKIRLLPFISMALTGLVLAGSLMVFQIILTPVDVNKNGESAESVEVIDYKIVPLAGSPDAPYVVTLLFDYQCSHCQKLHFMLDEAIRMYKGKLAFVLSPAPLSPGCNPYIPKETAAFQNSCELARISLAVWKAKREVFPDFENWMFSFETGDSWVPRRPEEARSKAIELTGRSEFEAAWIDPWAENFLQSSVQIYGKTLSEGKGGIPKMIFGSRWMIPESYNANDLVKVLQKSLGVPEP